MVRSIFGKTNKTNLLAAEDNKATTELLKKEHMRATESKRTMVKRKKITWLPLPAIFFFVLLLLLLPSLAPAQELEGSKVVRLCRREIFKVPNNQSMVLINIPGQGSKKEWKDVLHLLSNKNLHPLHQVEPVLSKNIHLLGFPVPTCFLPGTKNTCPVKKTFCF